MDADRKEGGESLLVPTSPSVFIRVHLVSPDSLSPFFVPPKPSVSILPRSPP